MTRGNGREGSAARSGTRPWLFACAAVAPVAALIVVKTCVLPRPYWVYFCDPEIVFYYTGIDIREGRPPSNTDHPGTTLQILTALITSFTGRAPADVDAFRAVVYWAGLALSALSAAALRRTLLRDLPFHTALACVWTYYLSPSALSRTTIWSPETIFLGVGGIALAGIDVAVRDPRSVRRAALAGVAVGVCVALKFTLGVLAPALLLAVTWSARRAKVSVMRPVAAAAAGIVVAFAAATSPAISRYPMMFAFLGRQLTHTGPYGAGTAAAPGLEDAASNLAGIVNSSSLWHAWLALCAALFVWAWIRSRSEMTADSWYAAVSVAAVTVVALGYGGVMRSGLSRYLMTGGVGAVALAAVASRGLALQRSRVPGWIFFGAAAAFLALAAVRDFADHSYWVKTYAGYREELLAAIAKLRGDGPEPVVMWGRRAPDPAYSLGCFATTDEQRDAVHRMFPTSAWFSPWHRLTYLPPGAARWDYFVCIENELSRTELPVGRICARAGPYVMVAHP